MCVLRIQLSRYLHAHVSCMITMLYMHSVPCIKSLHCTCNGISHIYEEFFAVSVHLLFSEFNQTQSFSQQMFPESSKIERWSRKGKYLRFSLLRQKYLYSFKRTSQQFCVLDAYYVCSIHLQGSYWAIDSNPPEDPLPTRNKMKRRLSEMVRWTI